MEITLAFYVDSTVTEFFPLFPGCKEIAGSYADKKRCSDNEMRKYLMQKAGYPKPARDSCHEGRVYIRYVVMPDGTVDKAEVVKNDTNSEILAEASLSAVESMNQLEKRWSPGMQNGRKIPVRIMMPFVFKLGGDCVPEHLRKVKNKKRRK